MERIVLPFARGVVLLFVAVVAAAGCGARTQPTRPAVLTEQPATLAAEPTSPAPELSEQPVDASASTAPMAEGTASSGQGDPSPPPTPRNNGMTVEVSKACVSPGDTQSITLRVPRRAGVTMVIGYSDRETHGHMNHGVADDEGVYVWTILLPPDVPPGTARVGATSTGANWVETGGEGDPGQAFGEFEVRPAGQCGT